MLFPSYPPIFDNYNDWPNSLWLRGGTTSVTKPSLATVAPLATNHFPTRVGKSINPNRRRNLLSQLAIGLVSLICCCLLHHGYYMKDMMPVECGVDSNCDVVGIRGHSDKVVASARTTRIIQHDNHLSIICLNSTVRIY